ncbi:MAG: hypothetical protein ACFFEU_13015, partial [Candidatus Thorarchaeota archaeon]
AAIVTTTSVIAIVIAAILTLLIRTSRQDMISLSVSAPREEPRTVVRLLTFPQVTDCTSTFLLQN